MRRWNTARMKRKVLSTLGGSGAVTQIPRSAPKNRSNVAGAVPAPKSSTTQSTSSWRKRRAQRGLRPGRMGTVEPTL